MSQPLLPVKAPAILSDFKPEWISERRGFANSIEISGRDDSWSYLTLPGEVTMFATEADRDAVLFALTQL